MIKPIEIVQRMYQLFGRRDIPGILECLAPDVEWEYAYRESPVPWLAPGRGREHVGSFFATMGSQLEIHSFTVNHILASDQLVIALVGLEATVRATGKRFTEIDEPHVWHFDDLGRVRRFRHAADTYAHTMALRP
jgi:hypothetical protein